MPIRIELSGADLARVRFAISPVYETVRAVRALGDPGSCAIHLPWVRWAAGRLPADPDLMLLRRLVAGRAVPISLLPTPDGRRPDIRDELRRVKNASPARMLESLDRIFGARPWLVRFRADPAATLARLAATIGRCHDALIAPHWPRMRALLEADIEFRTRRMAEAGVERVVTELHRDVRWLDEGGVLLHSDRPDRTMNVVTNPHAGLVLSPTIFSWPHATTTLRPTGPACMRYPARGIATLWELPVRQPTSALRELLGTTRAGILLALAEPSDTPTLARRLGVTPGAVSQHLRVLRNAGLVRTQRDGRTALHARTARAEALLG